MHAIFHRGKKAGAWRCPFKSRLQDLLNGKPRDPSAWGWDWRQYQVLPLSDGNRRSTFLF